MTLFLALLLMEDFLKDDSREKDRLATNPFGWLYPILIIGGLFLYFKLRNYITLNFMGYVPYLIVMIVICTISIPIVAKSRKRADRILIEVILIANLLCSMSIVWIVYTQLKEPLFTTLYLNVIDKIYLVNTQSILSLLVEMIKSILGMICYVTDNFLLPIMLIPMIQIVLYKFIGIRLTRKDLMN
jgi:hypothetical protein